MNDHCVDCGEEITEKEMKDNGGLCESCLSALVDDVKEEMEDE